jgi:indole-3-glycerol phosphate synthase/phosphoribosylanthranilate isomerase/anthranilate synthase/indole-3-glycerol phosphate synthase/phosphoribosylanthranilate isomerase
MTTSFLERITAATRRTVADRVARVPLDALRDQIAVAPAPRAFAAALTPTPAGPARLVAEVKHASPSKGVLAVDFDPAGRARAYAAGGAAAISVLTEPEYFLGALDHLATVRAAVDLPILRKDFILDPYQVYEARAAGADAVLLIRALIDEPTLRELLALTHALGMEALVEAHDAAEVRCAVAAGARVIGVNSRDLRTFAVDHDVVPRLRPLVPADRVFVAESGIADPGGALRARAWGADAILVGEALMRAADPAALARALATAGGGPTAALFAGRPTPFVKLCGLRDPAHARVAVTIGADAFGLIFAPVRRQVTPEDAAAIVRAAREAALSHSALPSLSQRRGAGGEDFPLAVGVFVDEDPTTIARIADTSGLDAVQLSGHEPPATIAAVASLTGLPILKAVRVSTEDDFAAVERTLAAGATPLLEPHAAVGDAPNSRYGGNGRPGDWDLAGRVAARWPMILAGGLTPANVAAALAAVRPRGVDVSSGTETEGVKDEAKLRAFAAAARGAIAQPD